MRFYLLFLLFLSIPSLASKDIPEAVRQAEKAVWEMSHNQGIDYNQSMGTAFFFGQNLLAANFHTVAHDLNLDDLITHFRFSQKGLFSDIKLKNLINLSPSHDLAIFKTDKKVSHYLKLPSEDPELTDSIFVIGYPGGSFRVIKNTNRLEVNENKIRGFFDFSNLPGISGSPALNEKGELIGMAYAGGSNLLDISRFNRLKKIMESKKYSINLSEDNHDEIESLIKEKISKAKNHSEAQYHIGTEIAVWKDKLTKEDLSWFEQSAEQGNSDAQSELGRILYEGEGVKKNLEQSLYWIQKSAEQGNAEAQLNLGKMFYYGNGVKQDFKKAFDLIKLTAEKGYAEAQYQLGNIFYRGKGAEKNLEQARYWYEQAAKRGDARAQFDLGKMLLKGIGVEKNPKKGIYWIQKSAGQGNIEAQFDLGRKFYYGNEVEKNLKKAIYWVSQSIEESYYSKYYRKKIKHLKKIFRWMEFVAEQGNAEAQFQLAELFYYGMGTKKDLKQARDWYELAAKQGHAEAQKILGYMFYEGAGAGAKKDLEQSRYWYKKAAEQGDADAQFDLAEMLRNEEGTEKNINEAIYWYRKAAEQDNFEAQYQLGKILYDGNGVKKNFIKAYYWIKRAANRGDADAKKMLKSINKEIKKENKTASKCEGNFK